MKEYLPPGTFVPTVGKQILNPGSTAITGGTVSQPQPGSGMSGQDGGIFLGPQQMQRLKVRAERNITTGRLNSIISAPGNFVYVERITPINATALDVGLTKAIYLRPDSGPAVMLENAPRLFRFAEPFSQIQIDSEPGIQSSFIEVVIGFGEYGNASAPLRVEPFWSSQLITRPANVDPYAANKVVGPQPGGAGYDLYFQNVFGAGRRYARITRARIEKKSVTILNADFVLHLWQGNGGSGLASTADQATFTLKENAANSYLGPIRFPAFITGGAGSNIAVCELNGLDLAIMNPDLLYLGLPLGPYGTIFGILEAQAAYVPVSGETFLIELFGERF